MAHLQNCPLGVGAFRDFNRKEISDIFSSIQSPKVLVIDPMLSGPLSLLCEYSLLKELGVEKIYYLQNGILETEFQRVVYLTRPYVQNMQHIANQIRDRRTSGTNSSSESEFYVYLCPRRTVMCERILEEEGVYGDVRIGEFHLSLLALDWDLLSLENPDAFKELFVDGDTEQLYNIAVAVVRIQSVLGIIPKLYGKGHYSQTLVQLIMELTRDLTGDQEPMYPEFDSAFLIDRSCDFMTPMLTQLTYEGLIDELMGIKNTFVELDPAITGQKDRRKTPLNSGDLLFNRLRDMNFAAVGQLLNQTAKKLDAGYQERHQAKTVSQLKEFVGKLGSLQQEHQSLRLHTNLADFLSKQAFSEEFHKNLQIEQDLLSGLTQTETLEHIEFLIAKQAPLAQVLRLLCIASLQSNGLKPKVYDFFYHEITQSYGYHHVHTLVGLEKAQLLRPQSSTAPMSAIPWPPHQLSPFSNLIKTYGLLKEETGPPGDPNDISYVYSGYAPLIVRALEYAYKNVYQVDMAGTVGSSSGTTTPTGHRRQQSTPSILGSVGRPLQRTATTASTTNQTSFEDAFKQIPGPFVEEQQKMPPGIQLTSGLLKRRVLIVFVGGCTNAELSALRFLSQQEGQPEYVVLTTHRLTGEAIIQSLTQSVDRVTLSGQSIGASSES